jgi:hypothetical protein
VVCRKDPCVCKKAFLKTTIIAALSKQKRRKIFVGCWLLVVGCIQPQLGAEVGIFFTPQQQA